MRFGLGSRSSKDLDAAFRGEIRECLELAADALEHGWNGFTGLVGPPVEITRAKVIPPPVRVEVKVRYRGKGFVTLPLEISAAEAGSLDEPEVVALAIDLTPTHLPPPTSVTLLPLRYQIAQKLHACAERFADDENARVRDLADLVMIRSLGVAEIDMAAIRRACIEIFSHRKKHGWPPSLTPEPGWDASWGDLARDEELATTLDDALNAVRKFVDEIDAAVGEPGT